MARQHRVRTQPLLHLEALPWPAQPPPLLPPPPSHLSPLEIHFKHQQQHSQPSAPPPHSLRSRSPLEAAQHQLLLSRPPHHPLFLLGQQLSPQHRVSGPQLNQHLEPAPLVLLSVAAPPLQLHPQPHRASVQRPRLRAPPQAPSHLAVLHLSRPPPALLSQHPVDLTLVPVCHAPSLEHQFPIILHHRWETSILGVLLLTNQLLGRLPHHLARVLLQVQFPLEALELLSKVSMLFLLGLQQLPPSPSEPGRSHLEHGRGFRHGGNTTGRSNLLHESSRAFQRTSAVAAVANLANIALF